MNDERWTERGRADGGQAAESTHAATGGPAALPPGGPRVAEGDHRDRCDLGDLPVRGEQLPHRDQPDEPGPPDHGRRADLGGRRARAAARRDRPLGRRGERSLLRDNGRAQRPARLEPLSRHRGRRAGRDRGRALPGVRLRVLRDPVVRRHPGRTARVAGVPAGGARRHGDGQPHRSQDHRSGRHLLQRRCRLGIRCRGNRRVRRRPPLAAGGGACGPASRRRRWRRSCSASSSWRRWRS